MTVWSKERRVRMDGVFAFTYLARDDGHLFEGSDGDVGIAAQ